MRAKWFAEEYWKHTVLNLGQTARDFRFFYYHPWADKVAQRGTSRHFLQSMKKRLESLGYNFFYALLPPHWHHTADDLQSLRTASSWKWFLHGYAPWRFPDPREGGKRNGSFTI